MDYRSLEILRQKNAAWRLLRADHAALITSFLYQTFVQPNVRTLNQPDLLARLNDRLNQLRRELGDDAFPKSAQHYLDDWASDNHGWLRKYYPPQGDEPHFDLTPAVERAIAWLASLSDRQFVGAESRLMTVFELLRQLVEGTQTDPDFRVAQLEKRKAELEAEIHRIRGGRLNVMDATAVKERFLQMEGTARGLLSDFREVEQNFRHLDRAVREKIATWEGGKAQLLDDIFDKRDVITDSDQGKSFRAFWDLLMSPARQEELSLLLSTAMSLEAVQELAPDRRLLRIHFDWLDAGDIAQRTVARLSEQLRRYLDDQAWLEDRRIMDLIRDVEQIAIGIREQPPPGVVAELDEPSPDIVLPMDRPLYAPPRAPDVNDALPDGEADHVPSDALFGHIYVDKARLEANIRRSLQLRPQISLAALVQDHPLEQGLAEIVSYFSLAAESTAALIDDTQSQSIAWVDASGCERQATVPLVIYSREAVTSFAPAG